MKLKGTTYHHNKIKNADIEIGDAKQEVFYPQMKTKHWGNESNFSIRLRSDYTDSKYTDNGSVVEWENKDSTIKARFYDRKTDDESGGFEFEVEFSEKPLSNIVEFSVQSKGLHFYKQGELSDFEKSINSKRPENVINSIAVYHDSKKHNKYKTGKAFHIYRLFVIDSNGWKVWCDQDIEGDTYKITIPQDFLDNAQYPIILDPTFGYTTIGGTLGGGGRDKTYVGCLFTMPGNGTIDTIYYYTELLSSRLKSAAIYSDSSNVPVNLLDESAQTSTGAGGTQWWDSTVNYVNSSGAVPLWLFQRSSWDWYFAYDVGASNQTAYKDDAAASSMVYENPMTSTSLFYFNFIISIYANYTLPPPGGVVTGTIGGIQGLSGLQSLKY